MPFAIFRYPPEDEFAVRKELSLLKTRLEQTGKRVTPSRSPRVHQAALDRRVPLDAASRGRAIGRARGDDRDRP